MVNDRKLFLFSLKDEVDKITGVFSYSIKNRTYNNTIYKQSSNKSKTLCIYDKSTEINERDFKNQLKDRYVQEYLKTNFNTDENITRIEIRLKNNEFTKYNCSKYSDEETIREQIKIDLLLLNDKCLLFSLFEEYLDRLFIFRKKCHYYDKKRYNLCKKSQIIKLNYDKVNLNELVIKSNQERKNRDKVDIDFINSIIEREQTRKYEIEATIKMIEENNLVSKYNLEYIGLKKELNKLK